MKKVMTIGLVAVLAAGGAIAQDDVVMVDQMGGSSTAAAQVTAEVALVSSYVWRGQVLNNDFVIQPALTVAQSGFSFNIWGNYDLGSNVNGTSSDFSEIDLALAYTLPLNINEMEIDVGVISYNFPANGDGGSSIGPSTTEVYARAKVLSWSDHVIPSVTFYGDVDKVDGTYILFDIVAPYEVSDVLAVAGGASAGWGNTSYNDHYWGYGPAGSSTSKRDAGWNDYNLYANASYEILENLTASLNLTYTFLEGGAVESGAKANYENNEKFWGGFNLAYDF